MDGRELKACYTENTCTVVKKKKLTARKLQNIFSLLRGVNFFGSHCIMVGVPQYIQPIGNEAEL